MMTQVLGLALALAVMSPTVVVQETVEPLSVWALHDNASYYDEREIGVSGYVVDSHIEWYGDGGSDYMTWNLVLSDEVHPDEQSHVLLCYESGFNIDRMRECSEIADIQKDLERQVTVIGEYDSGKDILNLRKFLYFEDGEPVELDTDLSDREEVRVYRTYHEDFDYDIHYVVWYRHSYVWPRPIWWLWWEPMYLVRPPMRYVSYYTPWCTYRRRIHPIRVMPHTRTVVHHDGHFYGAPHHRGDFADRGSVGRDPRVSRDHVAAPGRHVSEGSRTETQRVRTTPERHAAPERTRSPELRRVVPEHRESPTAREAPTPSPVRSAPRTRTEEVRSGSTQQHTRESSPSVPSVRAQSTSHHAERVSSGERVGSGSTHQHIRESSPSGPSVRAQSTSHYSARAPSPASSPRGHSVSGHQSMRVSPMASSGSRASFGGARRR